MNLTQDNKKHIDSLTYKELLRRWRFAPVGDLWFVGETGTYWGDRMKELRSQPSGDELHVQTSKRLGW